MFGNKQRVKPSGHSLDWLEGKKSYLKLKPGSNGMRCVREVAVTQPWLAVLNASPTLSFILFMEHFKIKSLFSQMPKGL